MWKTRISSMSATHLSFFRRSRRFFFEPQLAAAAEDEHGEAENEENNSPPEIGVDAETLGVERGVIPGADAEGGEDHAGESKHEAHGNAQIEIHCVSSLSGKKDIQRDCAE